VATALPAVGVGPLHLGLGATVAAATLLDARRFWANR